MLGKYHCPVTFKVFNDNTHIVAVRTTGNVYCMEVRRWANPCPTDSVLHNDIVIVELVVSTDRP